jgi:hypothetical protein
MVAKLKIYVAGPYSASSEVERELNTQKAIEAGLSLFKLGHTPFIPHLTHYVDLHAHRKGIAMAWEDYIRLDLEWLDVCDALLFLGSSKGADLELEYAVKKGKRIYKSLDEIEPVSVPAVAVQT